MKSTDLGPKTRRDLRNLLGALTSRGGQYAGDPHVLHLLSELERSLAGSPKRKAAKKARLAVVKDIREARSVETRGIYAQVERRAAGRCEACGGWFSVADPAQLDHQLGRGRARQSAQNTWLIHSTCHRLRTDSRPSALHWAEKVLEHAQRLGHAATANEVGRRIDGILSVREAFDASV